MRRQPIRRKCHIGVGDFIYLRGKYVTAKWKVVRIENGTASMEMEGPVRKEYVHPELFFYIGRPLWKRGLPAYPENKTLIRDYQAFIVKGEAMELARALIRLQKRITKLSNSVKILNCTETLKKAISEIKGHLKRT